MVYPGFAGSRIALIFIQGKRLPGSGIPVASISGIRSIFLLSYGVMNRYASSRLWFVVIICVCVFSCKKNKPLPAAPSGLTISNISDTGATIHWNATDLAISYALYIGTDAGFTKGLAMYNPMSVTALTVVLSELTPATKYYVKLVAKNENGEGAPALADFTTEDADGLVVAGCANHNLYAFSARDGHIVWSYSTGGEVSATPIIQDSVVYVGSLDGKLYAINAGNGSQKWSTGKMRSGGGISSTVTISKGIIYLGDYGGWFYAFDAKNGAELWSYIVPSPYRNFNAAAVVSGDSTIFIGDYDGKVYALNAATGIPRWYTTSTGNPLASGVALYNNTLYVGAMPKLYAFDAAGGALKWRGMVTGYEVFDASPTISNNKVLIGDESGMFYAFDAATGAIAWSRKLSNGSIMSSAMAVDGIVYVGDGGGVLYALDVATGSIVWSNNGLSTKNIYSGPVVTDKYVYVGTLEGKMCCVNRATGVTKWSSLASPGQGFYSSPGVLKYSGKTFHPGITGIVQ